ncbi:MAG: glycosyltransferase family 4 protein [Calditrichia bacterium]|nr:glycosyltransferase family 4 protein [Calditrichia bacterium]
MKQDIHILFLSQYFPPEMGAPSARTYELSRRWVEKNQKVTIITGFPNHPTGVIPKEYKQHIFKVEQIDGIRVIRTYIYPAPNKGFFRRILSYLSFMCSSILLGPWKTGRVDIVVATSPQFFVAIAGYLMSRIKRKPFIFEVRDLWPESIVQLGQLRNRAIIKLLEFIEVFLYKKADLIVVVAESSIPLIEQKGIPRGKIKIIKNGVDLNLFTPQKIDPEMKKKLGLEHKFIISYIGTLGLSHALDQVLETAKLLQDSPDIHFLLIGEGAEKEKLIHRKNSLGLTNVTFLDQIEKQLLPYYYSLSDIVLVTLRRLPLFQCVIPSKIFEIMAMEKPIIISVDGEARQLVINEAKAGIFVEPESPPALKEAILKCYQNPPECHVMGLNGRTFVEKEFSREVLADRYLEYLQRNSP